MGMWQALAEFATLAPEGGLDRAEMEANHERTRELPDAVRRISAETLGTRFLR